MQLASMTRMRSCSNCCRIKRLLHHVSGCLSCKFQLLCCNLQATIYQLHTLVYLNLILRGSSQLLSNQLKKIKCTVPRYKLYFLANKSFSSKLAKFRGNSQLATCLSLAENSTFLPVSCTVCIHALVDLRQQWTVVGVS